MPLLTELMRCSMRFYKHCAPTELSGGTTAPARRRLGRLPLEPEATRRRSEAMTGRRPRYMCQRLSGTLRPTCNCSMRFYKHCAPTELSGGTTAPARRRLGRLPLEPEARPDVAPKL